MLTIKPIQTELQGMGDNNSIDESTPVDLQAKENRGFVCPSCGQRIVAELTNPDASVLLRCVECSEKMTLTDR